MPLPLPPGTFFPPKASPTPTLLGPRVTGYRFDVMDKRERLIGVLDAVEPGGSIDLDSTSAIHGSGVLPMMDLGQDIDWLNQRIRPTAIIESVDGVSPTIEEPMGIYLTSAPVEQWNADGRSWRVELLDKCSILDQDTMVDPNGNSVTFSVQQGDNALQLVRQMIIDSGEDASLIPNDTVGVRQDVTWNINATKLRIINSILSLAGYSSLWCDRWGRFRTEPFVPMIERPSVYSTLTPFRNGPTSLMDPSWTRDRDLYSIPNRWVSLTQGTGDEESMIAVALNVDPASPFSYPSRGRWITVTEENVEVSTQSGLQMHADRKLAAAQAVTSKFVLSHAYLPDLRENVAVDFVNSDAGLSMKTVVTKTSIPLDPTALCKTEMVEAY